MTVRVYSVPITAIAVTAAQDIFYALCSSTVPIELHELILMQKTLTSWEAKDFTIRRFTATVTPGSGGASVTPVSHAPNDVASVTTCRRNDTTLATTSGTNTVIKGLTWNFLNDFYWSPAGIDDRLVFAPSQAMVIRLDTPPSASMTMSGTMVFAELV
jgi:hypothetical protein